MRFLEHPEEIGILGKRDWDSVGFGRFHRHRCRDLLTLRCRGLMRCFFWSCAAFPASSRISAIRYSRTAAMSAIGRGLVKVEDVVIMGLWDMGG